MNDASRIAAAPAALAGNPPLPTDGQVIREALSRLVPIAVSTVFDRWRKCPERRCRRERCCMAPQMECVAAPRLKIANIEEMHARLATRLREMLLDILLERALGREEVETSASPAKPAPSPTAERAPSPRSMNSRSPLPACGERSAAGARAEAGG